MVNYSGVLVNGADFGADNDHGKTMECLLYFQSSTMTRTLSKKKGYYYGIKIENTQCVTTMLGIDILS